MINGQKESGELFAKWSGTVKIGAPRNPFEMVATGLQLMVIKAGLKHGDFMPAVNRMGIRSTDASRWMAAARKFDVARHARLLSAAGSVSKMAELLPLDLEEINDLAQRGVVGPRPDAPDGQPLTIEQVGSMTVVELRSAVRSLCGHPDPEETRPIILTAGEERLLRHYRQCRQSGRELVERAAELMSKNITVEAG